MRALAAEALERYPRIEVLVNNAGAIFDTRTLTADGIERTWALNHLAPFLLTTLLIDRLEGIGAGTHHHHDLGRAQGEAHPVRRSQRRARLSRPRVHAVR